MFVFSWVEASPDEIKENLRSSGSRPTRKSPTAAKAQPKAKSEPKGKGATPTGPSKEPAEAKETPMKANKRCPKGPPPEATPETNVQPVELKRQRGKVKDPNPDAQIESLKKAHQFTMLFSICMLNCIAYKSKVFCWKQCWQLLLHVIANPFH